ncbi:hypothetical protein [Clostridium peptidivorans]|uniref:hypothetical protein n=1 Tax=Clostridium peptidivorans TaxID=100174 RepID=UPI001A9A3598|nr:hypothetical protein [Clostridium peptidivorans]
MKFKKISAGVLSVAVLSLSSSTAFAAGKENFKHGGCIDLVKRVMPISSKMNPEKQCSFNSFTGTVKKVTDFEGSKKGSKYVLVEDAEGKESNVIISKDTYIVDNEKIEVGSVITWFYDANKPMLMIYPPQYNAEVVVINNKGQNVKVDRFDKNLVSYDKSLKLNISEDTEVILQNGKPFKGELKNRKLIVMYGPSTRSIPAQTTPTKIIVLFEKPANHIQNSTGK